MAKKEKQLVPMSAVICPLCKGKGRITNEVIKTLVKCHGCEGKGWVEVHSAEPIPAPPFAPIQQPQQDNIQKNYPPPWSPNTYYTYGTGGTGSGAANGGGASGVTYTSGVTVSGVQFSSTV